MSDGAVDENSEVAWAASAMLDRASELFAADRRDEAFALLEEVSTRCDGSADPDVRRCGARAVNRKGYWLNQEGRYDEAIVAFSDLDARFGGVDEPDGVGEIVARGLLNHAVALKVLDRQEERERIFDAIVARFGDSDHLETREQVAKALRAKANRLRDIGRREEALSIAEQLDAQFRGPQESAELSETLAWALVGRGWLLGQLDRHVEEIEVYNELIARYSDLNEPRTRIQVARGLSNKVATLKNLKLYEEALVATEELEARLDDGEELGEVVASVVSGLLNRGVCLGKLGRMEAAISTYESLEARFDDSLDPTVREYVAWALLNKANLLRDGKRDEEAIAVCDALDTKFGGEHEPSGVMAQAAKGLLNRASLLHRLGRQEEIVTTCTALIERYGHVDHPKVRQVVANGMLAQAQTLADLHRAGDAAVVLEDLETRFGDGGDQAALRDLVGKARKMKAALVNTPDREASALFNEAVRLKELGRDDEVVAAYDDLVTRFGGSNQLPATSLLVATGMQNRAIALGRLGRNEEKLSAYDEIIARYRTATDPEMRQLVANTFHFSAITFGKLGQDEEAVASCADLISWFGGPGESDDVSLTVATALMTQAFALGRLTRNHQELNSYESLVTLFSGAENPEIRALVVKALYFTAGGLIAQERYEAAIDVCEQLEVQFDREDEPASTREVITESRELRALALRRLGTPDAAIQLYDEVLTRYAHSDDEQSRERVAEALHSKAATLTRLDREGEALSTYDDLLSRIAGWSDSRFDKALARGLDGRARVLVELGRIDEALVSFDEATEAVTRLKPEERQSILIEVLFAKAQALPDGREAEAVVLYDSILSAYSERAAEPSRSTTKIVVRAALQKLSALVALGRQVEIEFVPKELAAALGDVVTREPVRRESGPGEGSEGQLADLLAKTHASDCWFWFATADNDSDTRALMAKRALELYQQSSQWLGDSPEAWDSPVAATAFSLRGIADGYALLSIPWVEDQRAGLPLPTRPEFEWAIRETGVDEWAAEHGHPLDLRESTERVDAWLEEERTKMLELDDGAVSGFEERLLTGFVVAAGTYELFDTLASSERGRAAASDPLILLFAAWQISSTRVAMNVARRFVEDAIGVTTAMILMAEASFVNAHTTTAGAPEFPSKTTFAVLLTESDGISWLRNHVAELPPWLAIDEAD